MAVEASDARLQKMVALVRNRRNLAIGGSGVALVFILGAIQRLRRRGRGPHNEGTCGRQGRFGRRKGASIDQPREPCPVLWEQIQQRDWLFGLPPQIADSILARLDVQDLKALRATCRQTYLQVAARTTKLVRALDASPRTWRLLASPRLDSIYPGLRELHLILAGDQAGRQEDDEDVDDDDGNDGGPGGATSARRRPGPRSLRDGGGSRRGAAAAAAAGGGSGAAAGRSGQLLLLPPGGGGGGACASSSSAGPGGRRRGGPECLRDFVSWSANGHLHGLTLLDLSRCDQVPIHRDTWAALLEALGPGEVTLRVAWRALLHHGTAAPAAAAAAAASRGGSRGNSRGGGGGAAAAAAAKAKAKAAAAAGLLTPPMSPGGGGEAAAAAAGGGAAPSSPPRCTCSICGPSPPDPAPVVSALQVLAQLRPCCSVELAGRGLPVRSPAALQALCGVVQLASVSLGLCGVRPLSHHAGWFSCLRRLHSLELRYREEPGEATPALHQIVRALQAPVPLRRLVLHRPATAPLDEADLAALAQLPSLASLDAPGLRVHAPTPLVLPGLTRLALRSDRLELTQPLVALFPSLQHLELGNGAEDLPPTQVLAAAAAVTVPLPLAAAPAGPVEQGLAPADEIVVPAAAAAGGAAGGGLQQSQSAVLPQELTLHLRLLQGLSGLRVLSIGGKPGHGVEALSSLTALSSLVLVRCSEFRPLRKAVEELRGLPQLRSLELHACLGGDACGYEIARLLRRLQKLPNLERLVLHGCDPRLPQQLATAPLGRLGELQLLGLPELQPLDLRYVVQAQTGCRRLVVRGCGRLERRVVEGLPAATHRPLLAVEWAP
ncbi:hypothetical protein PLESTM_001683000 [Pleodorina starrii]|nr:hypothetical protein PLESTM_001683000 [Pleodorina starrii]